MNVCCARYALGLLSPQARNTTRIRSPQLTSSRLRPTQRAAMSSTSRLFRYTTEIPKELPEDEADDVLFNSLYGVRTIELNRPKKLNSLNGSMCRKILPRMREWEKSQMANVILMTGAGEKALCAGGDVAALAKWNKTKEGQTESTAYFALEYTLDHLISTYSKPYIAIMDGITMGGGVGLSVHAPFRIATEKTTFAMPETTIGFFPDVGGSFFLPRLDGEIGTYLALTSERLMGVQALHAGIATHYLDSSVLAPLTTRLSELSFRDHASLTDRLALINKTLAEFSTTLPSPDSYPKSPNGNLTGSLRAAIDRTFSHNTIPEIISALEKEASSPSDSHLATWAKDTLQTLSIRSPTSLKVTLKQLRLGRSWSIAETFLREYEMAARFMQNPDFTEGVTARLIEKRDPKWTPATLEEVSDDTVDSFFELPQGVREIELLKPSPDAQTDYKQYPWAKFGLPREKDIEDVVRNVGRVGKEKVMQEILTAWEMKVGVREKVEDVLARKTRKAGADGIEWKDNVRASL